MIEPDDLALGIGPWQSQGAVYPHILRAADANQEALCMRTASHAPSLVRPKIGHDALGDKAGAVPGHGTGCGGSFLFFRPRERDAECGMKFYVRLSIGRPVRDFRGRHKR
jgi:hypothetical protein